MKVIPPKPAGTVRTQLLLAALMWSTVGAALAVAGILWILQGGLNASWILAVGMAIGALKARFILRGTARRIASRIVSRGDGRCLGGFLSWRSWLLVASMALAGRLLRASPLPLSARGGIYLAIGTALLLASRALWDRWSKPIP